MIYFNCAGVVFCILIISAIVHNQNTLLIKRRMLSNAVKGLLQISRLEELLTTVRLLCCFCGTS